MLTQKYINFIVYFVRLNFKGSSESSVPHCYWFKSSQEVLIVDYFLWGYYPVLSQFAEYYFSGSTQMSYHYIKSTVQLPLYSVISNQKQK